MMQRVKDTGVLRLAGIATVMAAIVYLSGCVPTQQQTAAQHAQTLAPTQERRLTLGVVQSTIHEGIGQAAVATVLGSPNIVTTDAAGNETWIYDKIATETSQSSSNRGQNFGVGGGVGGGGLAGAVLALGGAGIGGSYSRNANDSASASAQTQRTLTVVIKFDENKLVSKVSYNQSAF